MGRGARPPTRGNTREAPPHGTVNGETMGVSKTEVQFNTREAFRNRRCDVPGESDPASAYVLGSRSNCVRDEVNPIRSRRGEDA